MGSFLLSLTSYGRLLRNNRNYRLLWMAQVVSEIGDWLYSLAIYSLLLSLTGSAKAVAIAVVLQLLPQVFVGPLAGVLNDRLSRKRVMIAADLARVVIVTGMLFAGRSGSVAAVYVLLGLETMMWAFFEPGRTAVVPNLMASKADTATATALSSATWSVNFAIGAALGGLIGVTLGFTAVFALNAMTFLVSALCISGMDFTEPHADSQPAWHVRELMDFTPYLEGVRYVTKDPRMMATMLVKAAFGALGIHWVVVPLFGERVFPLFRPGYTAAQAGLLSMSVLMCARGVGAMIGPAGAGAWAGSNPVRLRAAIGAGFAVMGLGYLGLGMSPSLVVACAALVVLASGASSAWTFSTTLLQLQTEDRFRGRVFSADFSLLLFNMAVMSYVAGVLIDRGWSVRVLSLVTGCAASVPVLLWWGAQRLWRDAAHAGEAFGDAGRF